MAAWQVEGLAGLRVPVTAGAVTTAPGAPARRGRPCRRDSVNHMFPSAPGAMPDGTGRGVGTVISVIAFVTALITRDLARPSR